MSNKTRQRQVVVIYANVYETPFTHKDENLVKKFADEHRAKYKKQGALKVITNFIYV